MPLTLDPDSTFRYVLETDRGRPTGEQPWFELKHRSHRNMAHVEKKIREGTIDELINILRDGLAGWGNLWRTEDGGQRTEIKFDPSVMDDILTDAEIGELLAAYRMQGWTADERKNSPSQPGSKTGPAAGNAGDPQDAKTGPAKEAPSSSNAPNAAQTDVNSAGGQEKSR